MPNAQCQLKDGPRIEHSAFGIQHLALPAIFLIALAVRWLYAIELRDSPLFAALMGDGASYDRWARQIAAGDWYGSEVFYQAPLYPYFLAVIYKLFGHDAWAARMVQIVIGSASCVLLAAAGTKFFSRRAGIAAGVILALYGPAIFFDAIIQKPVLAIFFTCALLLLAAIMQQRPRWWISLLIGITLGAFALTRENALILVPIVGGWLLWLRGKRWLNAAAFVLGMALLLVPVGLRNKDIGGQFLLTTAQMGPNLFIGNNPQADGRYNPLVPARGDPKFERIDAKRLADEATGKDLSPSEVSRYWTGRVVDYMRAQPMDWLKLMGIKAALVINAREIIDFESIEASREQSRVLALFSYVLHFGIVAPVGVMGIWLTRRRWRELWLLYAVLVGVAGSVAVFYIFARYRIPIVPVLVLFAAAGLVRCLGEPLRGRGRWGAVVILIVALVAMNWPLAPQWDPRAITYQNVGISMQDMGRWEDAERMFERVIAIYPTQVPPAHKRLAQSLAAQGRVDEAIPVFEQAMQHLPPTPDSAPVIVQLADLYAMRGRIDDAGQHYLMATQIDPARAEAFDGLAWLLATRRGSSQAPEALRHAQRACELTQRQNPGMLNTLAVALAVNGRKEQARQTLEAALALAQEQHDDAMATFTRMNMQRMQ
jgi:4-amino-4-deoxy-L-arabinose transferase-like glycosyltransferase/Flp pilus assembly protein TadD